MEEKKIQEQEVQDTACDVTEEMKQADTEQTEDTVDTAQEIIEEETETDETAEKIAALEAQVAENLDRYQRCLAEFDNFRKRTIKEKASMYDDGVKDTIEKLLGVVDNLERAVAAQAGKTDENDPFLKGVEMTLKQFLEILQGLGVTQIPAVGEKFDPNLHAAVAHEENEAYGENEVILEMLKGYQYKDKVIRPSMVKVAN